MTASFNPLSFQAGKKRLKFALLKFKMQGTWCTSWPRNIHPPLHHGKSENIGGNASTTCLVTGNRWSKVAILAKTMIILKHQSSIRNKSRKTAFQKVIDLVSIFAQPSPRLLCLDTGFVPTSDLPSQVEMANLKLAQNLCLCEPATKQTTEITTRNGM